MLSMGCSIKNISCFLSSNKISNEDLLANFPEVTNDEIYRKTGVRVRYNTTQDVLGSDLAIEAAEKLFGQIGYDKSDINFVVFCSGGHDFIAPMTICIIQEKLGLRNNIGAFDLPSGCSAFTNAIGFAKAIIESGQSNNILLLFGETPSLVSHPNDFALRSLFSDAGAAVLIEKTDNIGIGEIVYGVDGKGVKHLLVERSCLRNPIDENWLAINKDVGGMPRGQMKMNGLEILTFSLREVPSLVYKILEKNNLLFQDIDLFVFHQASNIILKSLQRKLKIPDEKMAYYMEDYGNTVSVSIPLALIDAKKDGRIRSGSKVLVAGYGIGFSWSGTVLYF